MKKSSLIIIFVMLFIAGCFEKKDNNDDDGIVWKVKDIISEEVIDAKVTIESPYITDISTDNMVEVSKSGYFSKMGIVPLKYGQKNLIGYLTPDFTKKIKYKLSGKIKDGDTEGVIGEANIAITGQFITKKSSTDINGVFEVKDIPEGDIKIVIYKDGYTSKTTDINLKGDIANIEKNLTKDSTKKYGDIIGSISGYNNDVCGYSYITVGMSGSDTYRTTFSDVSGNYAVYGIPYNSYTISCKTPGFYTIKSSTVTVSSITNTNNISMSIISGD
jgi:hypothetical protein